jgi:hypothetical protein
MIELWRKNVHILYTEYIHGNYPHLKRKRPVMLLKRIQDICSSQHTLIT